MHGVFTELDNFRSERLVKNSSAEESALVEAIQRRDRRSRHVIRESQPQSLGELSQFIGRQVSNPSRTLKTMCNYDLVELKRADGGKQLRPVVKAQEFWILAPA